jgi:cell division protein FtsB
MEFKTLYQFTIDKEEMVDKESKRTNKKTGEVTITKKKVKQKVPIEIKIKRPSRRQLEDAELQYSIEISKCVKQGILTKAMLAKKYADTGGTFSEDGFKEYGKLYTRILELQNEYMKLDTVDKPDAKQKKRLEQLKAEIAEVKRELVNVESGLQSLFDHTADVRAQNKLLLWYAEPIPYFLGDDFEEKTEDYYSKEEESSDFYQKVIKKVSTVLAFWFYNQASSPSEFEELIKKVESGEL